MLQSIDLANDQGSILADVVRSEDGQLVTLFLKFGTEDALNSSCIKLRFSISQWRAFVAAVRSEPAFPGLDLNAGGKRCEDCGTPIAFPRGTHCESCWAALTAVAPHEGTGD